MFFPSVKMKIYAGFSVVSTTRGNPLII